MNTPSVGDILSATHGSGTYTTPRLTVLGAVSNLTETGSNGGMEGDGIGGNPVTPAFMV